MGHTCRISQLTFSRISLVLGTTASPPAIGEFQLFDFKKGSQSIQGLLRTGPNSRRFSLVVAVNCTCRGWRYQQGRPQSIDSRTCIVIPAPGTLQSRAEA